MRTDGDMSPQGRGVWRWYGGIAAVVVSSILIAWPLGGLEDAVKEGPRQIGIGQSVTGHRVAIRPVRVGFATKDPLPWSGTGQKGRYLVLDMDVTNVSPRAVNLTELYLDLDVHADRYHVDPIADLHRQAVVRDDGEGGQINPGMAEKVRFAWVLPASVGDPRQVTVTMRDETWEPSWSLLGYSSGVSLWFKGEVMAILKARVERG
ncbi:MULTISPECIES: hypothetical protein [Nonomuraea]|uniref:DUF4352 domain-containing protein n=1 Tax=Nonomuraea mangrovi TaxID=2316207 RepID=A0ABW4TEM4_9ACTN